MRSINFITPAERGESSKGALPSKHFSPCLEDVVFDVSRPSMSVYVWGERSNVGDEGLQLHNYWHQPSHTRHTQHIMNKRKRWKICPFDEAGLYLGSSLWTVIMSRESRNIWSTTRQNLHINNNRNSFIHTWGWNYQLLHIIIISFIHYFWFAKNLRNFNNF